MDPAERAEEVRRSRRAVGALRGEVTALRMQLSEQHRAFRSTVAAMGDLHREALADRDARIAFLEERLAEYANRGRPC
jgi:hypothetical protein